MKPFLRIAAVTSALNGLLLPAVQEVASGALVKTGRPFDQARDPQFQGLNLYLLHVQRNTAATNEDLPTRGPNGELLRPPALGLDLFYLLTFYGDDASLVPQQMLGNVLTHLHTWPILTGDVIAALSAASGDPLLAESALAVQGDRIKFVLIPLTTEEMSRMWMVFQAPYALSVCIRASIVFLESMDRPAPTAPVRMVSISVAPGPETVVVGVVDPIAVGDTLAISVANAAARSVRLAFDDGPTRPDRIVGDQVRVTLDAAAIARHRLRIGPNRIPLTDGSGTRIAVADFELAPQITRVGVQTGRPTGTLGPRHGRPQDLTLTIQCVPAPDTFPKVQLVDGDRALVGSDAHLVGGAIQAGFTDVPPGTWRVRLDFGTVSTTARPRPRQGLAADEILVA